MADGTDSAREPFLVRAGIRPPFLALGALLVALALHLAGLGARVVPWPWAWGGVLFLAMGFPLMAWTLRLFSRHGTTHDPFRESTALVDTGPYRVSRNPMYLSLALVLLGIGILVGSVPFLLVPVAQLLAANFAYVPSEEKRLARLFGPAYDAYRARVRRWI